jgi:4-amino-4-deoxy-L-arabinose transferase-like glycosyltransferase
MLLRHDYVTLHANGIRYLEKAPLLYWAMAASMRVSQAFGETGPDALAVAARVPLALSVLALALLCEAFARPLFASARAGLYAALILLSSFGMYLFTRTLIPDAMLCLWTTLALYAFWHTEQPENRVPHSSRPYRDEWDERSVRRHCYLFALACALNVLTKGLIGVVFPVAIVLISLLATRGLRGAVARIGTLHPRTSTLLFLVIAAPWHILAGLANPGHGHPAPFVFAHGHWIVPLPTDGNVRGWFWFYFMNEHLLRYLSLRVPHDYDTAPLWFFWGLCLLWLMPWSAFLFKAAANAIPLHSKEWILHFRSHTLPPKRRGLLLLVIWASFVLIFFALSSRQEYYVLPSLPALAILLAEWLAGESKYRYLMGYQPAAYSLWRWKAASREEKAQGAVRDPHRAALRCLYIPLGLGTIILLASLVFLLRTPAPSPNADLASLLTQNPSDYALSLGHFLDLTGPAIELFRAPLLIAALSLFIGTLAAFILRKRNQPHRSNLALAAGSFGFLIAVLWGLNIFSPVLTSAQLAEAIRPQLKPTDLVCIHGEYESGSTLGFYLQRPSGNARLSDSALHILDGRSSNLWYGSFFPDAPAIFETPATLAAKWSGPQRIFLWQSLTNSDAPPNTLPPLPGPVYILVKSGGKEIVSNQPNR